MCSRMRQADESTGAVRAPALSTHIAAVARFSEAGSLLTSVCGLRALEADSAMPKRSTDRSTPVRFDDRVAARGFKAAAQVEINDEAAGRGDGGGEESALSPTCC